MSAMLSTYPKGAISMNEALINETSTSENTSDIQKQDMDITEERSDDSFTAPQPIEYSYEKAEFTNELDSSSEASKKEEDRSTAEKESDESSNSKRSENIEETPFLAEKEELNQLRSEIEELRKKLADSQAMYDRIHVECAEFSDLYPDVSLSSLPDSIWESVKKGVPIAAAYALEDRRTLVASQKAERINKGNRTMSSGTLASSPTEEYFSPSEVRSMSSAEVRANYTKIINSMSKWH